MRYFILAFFFIQISSANISGMIYSKRPFEPQVVRISEDADLFFYFYCPNKNTDIGACGPLGRPTGYTLEEIKEVMKNFKTREIVGKYVAPVLAIVSFILPLKIGGLMGGSMTAGFTAGMASSVMSEEIFKVASQQDALGENMGDGVHYNNSYNLTKLVSLPNKISMSQFILNLEEGLTRLDRCTNRGRARCRPYDKAEYIF